MFDQSTIAFIIAATILTITPGNDTMLIVRNSIARDRTSGFATLFGILSGLVFHGSFAALGLSVILMQSATAFNIIKFIGAAFLVGLGIMALRSAWRTSREDKPIMIDRPPAQPNGAIASLVAQVQKSMTHLPESGSPRRSYIEGLLTNLLNPKVALFYLSFLPQFVSPADSFYKPLVLASIHITLGVVWLSLLILMISRLRSIISRPRIKAVIESVAGTILIGLGIRLAIFR